MTGVQTCALPIFSGGAAPERVAEAFGVHLEASDGEPGFDTIGGLIAHVPAAIRIGYANA